MGRLHHHSACGNFLQIGALVVLWWLDDWDLWDPDTADIITGFLWVHHGIDTLCWLSHFNWWCVPWLFHWWNIGYFEVIHGLGSEWCVMLLKHIVCCSSRCRYDLLLFCFCIYHFLSCFTCEVLGLGLILVLCGACVTFDEDLYVSWAVLFLSVLWLMLLLCQKGEGALT